jgi:predicted CXXCH cytochrome family protein
LTAASLDGGKKDFPLERVIGVSPLRQFLAPTHDGRFQVTELAIDPHKGDWFDVFGNEDRKPGEWGHWTGRGMNWNSMCATCHNTRVKKNYDAASDSFRTRYVENGVGCESCHGPMQAHNDWQNANRGSHRADPTIRKLTREQMFETCAACHSRRAELTGDAQAGDRLWDHHLLSIVDQSEQFYADGQVREEDFEFTAFLGSRMHNKGVRCIDCHDPHTAKTKLPGNFLCLSCHSSGTDGAPIINPVSHSHHKVFGYDSNGVLTNTSLPNYQPAQIAETGGECINCHMPQTTYMQRHGRHDHGFTIPDPLLTKQFGIPNACERCHSEKGTDWNLKFVEQWYGAKMDRPYRHRAQTVARARRGDDAARAPLQQMLATDDIPYWRAVAANLLQPWAADPDTTAGLLAQIQNTNALVREMVIQSLGPLAESRQPDVVAALQSRLADPSRNVRVEAARHLASTLDTNTVAGRDYLNFLDQVSDQPLGQLQAAVFNMQRSNPDAALNHLHTAVKWDPFSTGIREQLAVLLSQTGHPREAVEQLEEALKISPTEAELHYKLALGLNEIGETGRVLPELELAVKYNPRHARAWYNLGLARSGRGDLPGALEALARAESVDSSNPRIPYARATVLARLQRFSEARRAARRALEIDPNFSDAAQLLRQLEGR